MIPEHERVYEEELRSFIRSHREAEEQHRAERQKLEARLRALLMKRCPPAFDEGCWLVYADCPFYHEGQCVKVEEETI